MCLAAAALLPLFSACNDKAGSLGVTDEADANTSQNGVLELPLSVARVTSPQTEAQDRVHDWIRRALAQGSMLVVTNTPYDKTVELKLINAPALPGGLSLVWDFGDHARGVGLNVQHTYPAVRPYPVTVSIHHELVGPTAFDQTLANPVDGWPLPAVSNGPVVAAMLNPLTGPAPLTVSFNGSNSSSDQGAIQFYWDFNDGTYSTAAQGTHTFANAGQYIVALSVTDAAGRTSLALVVVNATGTANPAPTPPPSGSTPTNSPNLPAPPVPGRTFAGYMEDGARQIYNGVPTPTFRHLGVQAMPQLARYGFKRYCSAAYLGIARSPQDATGYFAPLTAAAQANGMKFVPGMFLQHLIEAVYGYWDEAPWNAPPWNLQRGDPHPLNPTALGQQAFWDELVTRARILAQAAQSDQVYLDCEFVFRDRKNDPFWTPANLAVVRGLARNAVTQLQSEGIFLMMFHPFVNRGDAALKRIAEGIFVPADANDPLATIEHMAPAPYYMSTPTGNLITQAQVTADYANAGFFISQLRLGFASSHISYGFSPANYDAYCNANPGVADVSWYFCPNSAITSLAAQFDALAVP